MAGVKRVVTPTEIRAMQDGDAARAAWWVRGAGPIALAGALAFAGIFNAIRWHAPLALLLLVPAPPLIYAGWRSLRVRPTRNPHPNYHAKVRGPAH